MGDAHSGHSLVSAAWILPVRGEPVRDGAILVEGDTIAAVGPRDALRSAYPSVEQVHFDGCTITPGLVNAHTHLTLTALGGVVPPLPFAQWLPRLVAALRPWEIADHEASGVVGAEESLRCGVTVVGDIAYGAAEVARASEAGLGGVFYWELLGIAAEQVNDALQNLRYPPNRETYGPRVICGLSAHSPYTSGPGLLQAVHALAGELAVPHAIHLGESQAELDLLLDGSGPLAATASRTALGFTAPHATPAAYLHQLGVLPGITAVHACHLTDADVETLARTVRGVVTCPRSNRYLDNPPPSVRALLDAGLTVGVGTDSSASNTDLDLLAEVRCIRDAEPSLTARDLLRLATHSGAQAIGVGERFGVLAEGAFADLAVFRVCDDSEPESSVVERGGRDTTEAVMSGGVWRVGGGQLIVSDAAAAQRAQRARSIAENALREG